MSHHDHWNKDCPFNCKFYLTGNGPCLHILGHSCTCKEPVKPTPEAGKDAEIVICAAIRMPDGYIIRGHRHHNCIATQRGIEKYKGARPNGNDQGFVTSKNRYVTRKEGLALQLAARIPSAQGEYGDELYSEDLYQILESEVLPEPIAPSPQTESEGKPEGSWEQEVLDGAGWTQDGRLMLQRLKELKSEWESKAREEANHCQICGGTDVVCAKGIAGGIAEARLQRTKEIEVLISERMLDKDVFYGKITAQEALSSLLQAIKT